MIRSHLPPKHPRRFFTAQALLYVGFGVVLLAAVQRSYGADPQLAAGLATPASAFTEQLQTAYGRESSYERDLVGSHTQIREEEKKREPLLADRIPLHLDGILCHAASVLTLLYGLMPQP